MDIFTIKKNTTKKESKILSYHNKNFYKLFINNKNFYKLFINNKN